MAAVPVGEAAVMPLDMLLLYGWLNGSANRRLVENIGLGRGWRGIQRRMEKVVRILYGCIGLRR
jgi:hypothetical protein